MTKYICPLCRDEFKAFFSSCPTCNQIELRQVENIVNRSGITNIPWAKIMVAIFALVLSVMIYSGIRSCGTSQGNTPQYLAGFVVGQKIGRVSHQPEDAQYACELLRSKNSVLDPWMGRNILRWKLSDVDQNTVNNSEGFRGCIDGFNDPNGFVPLPN